MRGWFRSLRWARPEPVQPPKPDGWEDRGYAAAHGFTLTQWNRLTDQERAWYRLNVAHAMERQQA